MKTVRTLQRQESEKRDNISPALSLKLLEDGHMLSMGEQCPPTVEWNE